MIKRRQSDRQSEIPSKKIPLCKKNIWGWVFVLHLCLIINVGSTQSAINTTLTLTSPHHLYPPSTTCHQSSRSPLPSAKNTCIALPNNNHQTPSHHKLTLILILLPSFPHYSGPSWSRMEYARFGNMGRFIHRSGFHKKSDSHSEDRKRSDFEWLHLQ